ncbi:tetratricopeptide repeat protein [Streptomyces sp. NPDC056222]|uniref:tetratricopeptide repeat protein n=1 Tax=Streptomyces sp. NPDC056222 TaxID=3345749 RepID=UPI0035E378EA
MRAHETLLSRGNLPTSYVQAGRTGEAIDVLEQVAADCARVLGDDHPDTLHVLGNLALSFWQAGRTGEAVDPLERLVADYERLLGDDHPNTLTARGNIAALRQHTRHDRVPTEDLVLVGEFGEGPPTC